MHNKFTIQYVFRLSTFMYSVAVVECLVRLGYGAEGRRMVVSLNRSFALDYTVCQPSSKWVSNGEDKGCEEGGIGSLNQPILCCVHVTVGLLPPMPLRLTGYGKLLSFFVSICRRFLIPGGFSGRSVVNS